MLKKICENKIHLLSAVHGDKIPLENQWNFYSIKLKKLAKNMNNTQYNIKNN